MNVLRKATGDSVLALTFKMVICATFCRDKKNCKNCRTNMIDKDSYKKLRIRDIVDLPEKRRGKA